VYLVYPVNLLTALPNLRVMVPPDAIHAVETSSPLRPNPLHRMKFIKPKNTPH
jgi:hypothetical protein